MQYQEYVNDAIENYKSLPYESNELYKKYSVNIPIGLQELTKQSSGNREEMEGLAERIAKMTGISFDLVITDSFVKNSSDFVEIKSAAEFSSEMIGNKIFKSSDDKMAALANASASCYALMNIGDGKKEKVNVLILNKHNLALQILIKMGKNARLNLFEFYLSAAEKEALVIPLHEAVLEKGAELEMDMVHNENEKTYVMSMCKAVAGEDSHFRANLVFNGGSATKSRNIVDANGERCTVDISEIVFGNKEQKFDLYSYIENSKQRSSAKLDTGAVLDGKAQCMMKGYAKVENGTKGAVSKITERGILLSMDAHIDALPDMSIDFSDEVKATHSAATAPMDQEAVFYLNSRGLSKETAERLFITAFISKYLSNINDGIAKETAMSIMLSKLEKGTFGEFGAITPRGIWAASV